MRKLSLLIALSVVCSAAACTKKADPPAESKKKDKDEGDDKGSTKKKKKGDDKGDKGDDKGGDEEAPKKAKGGAGCKLPESGSTLSADWTFSKGCTLVVKENLHVAEGAVLTIEPGVTLKFETNVAVWVDYGKIVAKGTEEEPITLTSNNKSPAKGDWVGVRLAEKTSAGTVFDHVKFDYTGHDDNGKAAIAFYGHVSPGRVAITNSTFAHAEDGVLNDSEDSAFAKLEGNDFKGVEGTAVTVHASGMGSLGKNKLGGKPIHTHGTIKASQNWPEVDGPIVVDANIEVNGDKSAAIVKIADKTTVKFTASVHVWIGGGNGGGVQAKEVTFTSANATAAAGDWSGFILDKKTTNLKLEDCVFKYAGHDDNGVGAIRWYGVTSKEIEGGVTITGCTFEHITGPAFLEDGDKKCGKVGEPAAKNKSVGGKLCGPA